MHTRIAAAALPLFAAVALVACGGDAGAQSPVAVEAGRSGCAIEQAVRFGESLASSPDAADQGVAIRQGLTRSVQTIEDLLTRWGLSASTTPEHSDDAAHV